MSDEELTQLMATVFGNFILMWFIVAIAAIITFVAFVIRGRRDKRIAMLRNTFGGDIKIYNNFPIDQDVEEIIQGGLSSIFQQFQELLVCPDWLYIRITSLSLPAITISENRGKVYLGLFARPIYKFTPYIVIRNSRNKSFVSRQIQTAIDNGQVIWCEAEFDKNHEIYVEQDQHIDVLSILSPEVLETMMNAPANADIILKRNQLYYIVPGNKLAETIVPELIKHSDMVLRELRDNLGRWARSSANKQTVAHIRDTKLAVTLHNEFESRRSII